MALLGKILDFLTETWTGRLMLVVVSVGIGLGLPVLIHNIEYWRS